jgi:transposase
LEEAGALHQHPELVRAALFARHRFFDPLDKVQVKYEMLRACGVDGGAVSSVARVYGFSREMYYATLAAFRAYGIVGLADGKRGRPGPLKVTTEAVSWVLEPSRRHPALSGRQIAGQLAEELGIEVHRRTIDSLGLVRGGQPPTDDVSTTRRMGRPIHPTQAASRRDGRRRSDCRGLALGAAPECAESREADHGHQLRLAECRLCVGAEHLRCAGSSRSRLQDGPSGPRAPRGRLGREGCDRAVVDVGAPRAEGVSDGAGYVIVDLPEGWRDAITGHVEEAILDLRTGWYESGFTVVACPFREGIDSPPVAGDRRVWKPLAL